MACYCPCAPLVPLLLTVAADAAADAAIIILHYAERQYKHYKTHSSKKFLNTKTQRIKAIK